MRTLALLLVAGLLLVAPPLSAPARAQCILANPSFELGGSGGAVFGGWYQFGPVGSTAEASHGSVAARVSGPNQGGWDVAGYWQEFDCVPGEQWEATFQVRHPSTRPLTGQSRAIVNIEWRDGGGGLIGYESHTAADASAPTDEYREFSVVSGPAPAGTAKCRLLLGVLQAPTDPVPDVFYDQATFYSLASPTMDEQQWGDFPGGRTLSFGGRTWRVKGPGYYGPGPNLFSDGVDDVWVDPDGRLHLTVSKDGGSWYSTEVVLEEALGYGDYVFTTRGRLDTLDPAAVFGLFLWQYGPCWDDAYTWWNAYDEIDVEFGRWGDLGREIAQFVAQPWDYPGNIDRFDAAFATNEVTSHAFRWLPDRVEFRSWRGGPGDESAASLIHAWTYEGPHVPRPEQPRVHLNLWRSSGVPAADQEVVLDGFTFRPESDLTAVAPDGRDGPPRGPLARLGAARPNPFNPLTTIRFTLERDATAEVAVYDLAGRRLRTLTSGFLPAGEHETTWDGRDDRGGRVASGTYLYRLRAGNVCESRRVTLIK